MGYTHSTFRPEHLDRKCFSRFVGDVKTLIEYAKTAPPRVQVCGRHGVGEPTLTDEMVEFNGSQARGEDCESLLITRTARADLGERPRNGTIFSFCKTEHMPYDVLVVASYFALMHHCAEIEFHSDGTSAQ
jgi:hypothetical protein